MLEDWQLSIDASMVASPVDATDGALQSDASDAEGVDASETVDAADDAEDTDDAEETDDADETDEADETDDADDAEEVPELWLAAITDIVGAKTPAVVRPARRVSAARRDRILVFMV